MNRFVRGALFALILLDLVAAKSLACGDKFLVKHGTLTKARCTTGLSTGSILIYRDAGSKSAATALGKDLERTLTNGGNTIQVVESREEFENALRKDQFDVVLSAYPAARAAEKILKDAGKQARIVPVVEKENEDDVRSAREQFGSVIKDTDRTSTKALIINEILMALPKTS